MRITNTPTLETERLILRRFTEADAEALYSIYRDIETNRFLPWFPVASPRQAQTLLRERYLDSYEQPRGYRYAVCLRFNNTPIGYVHLDADGAHDLGYGLRSDYWHRGIAAEAARAVIEQAKRDGIPFVTATHDVTNPGSGSVMRRLGMQYQYSYRELWQPKNYPVIFRLYLLNLDDDPWRTFTDYWDHSAVHFFEPGL